MAPFKKNFILSNDKFILSDENFKRDQRILSEVNLEKLPFKISVDNFSFRYLEMFLDLKPLFKYKPGEYAMKWCLSTEKKMKVFLLIFEANEQGTEVYKENIASQIPEYSYKTIAQIIDQGVAKGFFVKLSPRKCELKDSKIRNIRPSEELVVQFMNWNIDLISTISGFQKKYQ
tara:strand:- start:203 stop:724 length:522 start_codon:yes stop_codon:yes gene_type:complete